MMDSEHLKRLLTNSALGDQEAFTGLYDLTSPYLFALAIRILCNRDLAQDVLQDAFVQIWYRARDYHADKGEPLAWMTGIVRYRALDARRREHSQLNRAMESYEEGEAPEVFPDPADSTENSEELNKLLDCMDDIQGQQRQSILMAFYYGYTHGELAKRLNEPLGTIKTWIRRGLTSIRECLQS